VKVEILHIDECPNWEEAGARIRAVLDQAGQADVHLSYRLLRTAEEAASMPFAGSPTILIDGCDAFPSAAGTNELACRIYPTESGLAGLPSIGQLRAVFAASHSACCTSSTAAR
jgi:hypothetical protein